MTKDRTKKIAAWVMLCAGLAGALLSAFGILAPDEPPLVVQLSWGAFWTTGIVGVIAADDSGIADDDVDRIARRVATILREDA